jgi:signal transduction histidine kinase
MVDRAQPGEIPPRFREQEGSPMTPRTAPLQSNREGVLRTEADRPGRTEAPPTSAEERLFARERELVEALALAKRSRDELAQTRHQLIDAERMASAGFLSAGVAHDLKNHLTILMGGAQYLAARLADADVNVRDMLDKMREAGLRARTLVLGLVDFSAPRRLEFKPRDLHAVLESALYLSHHEFIAHHVLVQRRFADRLPQVEMTVFPIEQVFVNLFINAAHAMNGGGTLTVRTGLVPDDGEGQITIEIEDTGHGIPPEALPRVFEPYFTTKPPGKGNGLGLCIVRQVIALHGGTIDLANRDEGGVRVTIALPERRPDSAAPIDAPSE